MTTPMILMGGGGPDSFNKPSFLRNERLKFFLSVLLLKATQVTSASTELMW